MVATTHVCMLLVAVVQVALVACVVYAILYL